MLQEQAHHIHLPLGRRGHQGGEPLQRSLDIRLSALDEKQLDRLGKGTAGGVHQSCATIRVFRFEVGTFEQQVLDDRCVAIEGGPHQRGAFLRVGRVDRGPLQSQLFNQLQLTQIRGLHQLLLQGGRRSGLRDETYCRGDHEQDGCRDRLQLTSRAGISVD